ncbi:MAG: hypothetical protein ACK59J_22185 [Pseudanabaena sp.]
MSESIKATRATVAIGGLTVDALMLPDSSYRMSQTQASEAVGLSCQNVFDFLRSNAIKALLEEGYTSSISGNLTSLLKDNGIEPYGLPSGDRAKGKIMSESIKATRATVAIGGLTVDAFMLPDDSSRMSLSQAANSVGKEAQGISNFLRSKALQRLLEKAENTSNFCQKV